MEDNKQGISHEAEVFLDKFEDKFNLFQDLITRKYSMEKYSTSVEIIEYFSIDKPTFSRFVKSGMPVIKIGSRWKGKLNEIEQWFKDKNKVHFS